MRVPIRYKGKTRNYVDPICDTGITWSGAGDVRRVPKRLAPHFLHEPLVFEDARSPSIQKKQPIKAKPYVPKPKYQEEEPPLVPLESMDKPRLVQHLALHFGERITDTSHITREQLRDKVIVHMRGGR